MEIINALADFFGLSPQTFTFFLVAGVILAVGWAILKTFVQIAWRTFVTGCLLLVLLIGGIFVGSFLLNMAQ
jgi:hypothetical protein